MPFAGCTPTPYLSQPTGSVPTGLFQVDTSTNPVAYLPIGPVNPFPYDAIGYRQTDNYIYGIESGSPNGRNVLMRVGSDGLVQRLGAVTGLPVPINATYSAGEVGTDGFYYVKRFGTTNQLYRIDLGTRTASLIVLNQAIAVNDLACTTACCTQPTATSSAPSTQQPAR